MAETPEDATPAKKPAAKKPTTPKAPAAGTAAPKSPAAKKPVAKSTTPAPTPIEAAPAVPAVPVAPAAAHQPNPYADNSAPVPPTPYAGQPSYAAAPAGPPRGLAITSMILGICAASICCTSLVVGIAAVITGHIAQRSQPYARGYWLTGLITGYVGIAISAIYWVFTLGSMVASGVFSYIN